MIGWSTAFAGQLVSVVASAPTPTNQPGGQGQEFGSSSPVALVVIILLFVAVAFLTRSMTKHLKRVPNSFEPEADGNDEPV